MTYSGGGLPLARHGNSTGSPPLTKYFTPAGGPFTIDGGACPEQTYGNINLINSSVCTLKAEQLADKPIRELQLF